MTRVCCIDMLKLYLILSLIRYCSLSIVNWRIFLIVVEDLEIGDCALFNLPLLKRIKLHTLDNTDSNNIVEALHFINLFGSSLTELWVEAQLVKHLANFELNLSHLEVLYVHICVEFDEYVKIGVPKGRPPELHKLKQRLPDNLVINYHTTF